MLQKNECSQQMRPSGRTMMCKSMDVPWKVKKVNVWWTLCTPCLHLEVKIGRGRSRQWKNQRMGNQDNDTIIPSQKTKGRDVGRIPYENVQYGQEDVCADGPALLMRKNM